MSAPYIRTQCRVRQNDGEYQLVDVLAGVKVAGYTFLIHASVSWPAKWSATYAPIGIGIKDYDSIAEIIAALDRNADKMESVIGNTLKKMAETTIPMLAPEYGIVTEKDWRYRESQRFINGEYRVLPRIGTREYPKDHYVHLSVTKTESDYVAYTPSEAYGQIDRQVRLKFGKYLKKAFTDISDTEVQSAVVGLRAQLALEDSPATLAFATDRATINEIFETEMYACNSSYSSCMHNKFDRRDVRPYHVYADSPDVAVAYVMERGAIVARSVVSTKDKEWVRCYSIRRNDSTLCGMLERMLEAKGYSEGDLVGNRLTKLSSWNGEPQLPYIDCGGMGVTDEGKYWVVCEENEGDYNADQTDGTATKKCGNRCDSCGCRGEDCGCYMCDCCETISVHGCDDCTMCDDCDRCIEHDSCGCHRCSECNNIVNPSRRHTSACECDRCSECGELANGCECEKCGECGELTENCDCVENVDCTYIAPEDRTNAVSEVQA